MKKDHQKSSSVYEAEIEKSLLSIELPNILSHKNHFAQIESAEMCTTAFYL